MGEEEVWAFLYGFQQNHCYEGSTINLVGGVYAFCQKCSADN